MDVRRVMRCVVMIVMVAGCQVSKTASATQHDPLSEHEWNHRVVVMYRGEDDGWWRAQLEEFDALERRRDGWGERALVLYVCGEDGGEVRDHTDTSQTAPEKVSEAVCETLRARGVEKLGENHGVYLVGKDGGLKHATTELFETDALFGLIDSMPMRQREMRRISR